MNVDDGTDLAMKVHDLTTTLAKTADLTINVDDLTMKRAKTDLSLSLWKLMISLRNLLKPLRKLMISL